LEDLGLDERTVMKRNFRERNGEQGMYFGGSGVGSAVGSCECADEN